MSAPSPSLLADAPRLLTGLACWATLAALVVLPPALFPEQARRGAAVAAGSGRVIEARLAEPTREPVRTGTEVYAGDQRVGWVAADLGGQRLQVLVEGDVTLEPLEVELNPAGLRWAVEQLVTPEVIQRAVQQAAKAQIGTSMSSLFGRMTRRLERRFPDIYAEHKDRLDGELKRLWNDTLASQAEHLTKTYVLPKMSKEIPFGKVARSVAYETYNKVGIKDTAVAVWGDEAAQNRLQKAAMEGLGNNEDLRKGLKRGAAEVWADPEFKDELGRSVRKILENRSLRDTAGEALMGGLKQMLPDLKGDLQREFRLLEARGLDLSPVFRKLLLDPDGALRPALARVLRREVLRKDRYRLVSRKR